MSYNDEESWKINAVRSATRKSMIIMRFILKIILLGTFLTGCALLLGHPFGVPIIFLILLCVVLVARKFRSQNRSGYYHESVNYPKGKSRRNSRSRKWGSGWFPKPATEAQKDLARSRGYELNGDETSEEAWDSLDKD